MLNQKHYNEYWKQKECYGNLFIFYFTVLSIVQTVLSNNRMNWNLTWCGKKWLWHHLGHCLDMLGQMEENHKNFSQINQSLAPDLNPGHPTTKIINIVITTTTKCSIHKSVLLKMKLPAQIKIFLSLLSPQTTWQPHIPLYASRFSFACEYRWSRCKWRSSSSTWRMCHGSCSSPIPATSWSNSFSSWIHRALQS